MKKISANSKKSGALYTSVEMVCAAGKYLHQRTAFSSATYECLNEYHAVKLHPHCED